MQVRVDDDMRVILTLTGDEYAGLGGEKDAVARAVEGLVTDAVVSVAEPVIVTPNAEFAIPAGSFSESSGTSVTTPEVMTE